MKCEIKWIHLCQGVLKWSQEAIKEVDLMHILTQLNHELGQTTSMPRALQKPLKLVTIVDFTPL